MESGLEYELENMRKKGMLKNYNPAILSVAPIRIPNMDVEADNIPKRI
jgi:hypothetical protein